ncbi:securin isoform X2 [Festucalex cinctus]
MAHINAERDNQILAPLTYVPEMSLKTPLSAKTMKTPLRTGRKALSRIVNTDFSTPVVKQEKKTEKLQEPKVKHAPLKEEDYPEIEKLIPYDPMVFPTQNFKNTTFPRISFLLVVLIWLVCLSHKLLFAQKMTCIFMYLRSQAYRL